MSGFYPGKFERAKLRSSKMQEKYLREKILPNAHVVVLHRGVGVLVLPRFVVGRRFKLKVVKS